MAGNAAEEALFQQANNPTHTDVARISVPAGGAIAIAGYFVLRVFLPVLGPFVPAAFGAALGLWLGLWLHRRLERQILERDAALRQAEREAQEAATEAELAAFKARTQGDSEQTEANT